MSDFCTPQFALEINLIRTATSEGLRVTHLGKDLRYVYNAVTTTIATEWDVAKLDLKKLAWVPVAEAGSCTLAN